MFRINLKSRSSGLQTSDMVGGRVQYIELEHLNLASNYKN